jgi:hypothetical protein
MRDEGAEGAFARLAAVGIPTRAAHPNRGVLLQPLVGERLTVAVVGEGAVQGRHPDAAGGIAERGVAQVQAGPAHRMCCAAAGRWRCRKLAALLRPQPAASARVRAVQGLSSGRWAQPSTVQPTWCRAGRRQASRLALATVTAAPATLRRSRDASVSASSGMQAVRANAAG